MEVQIGIFTASQTVLLGSHEFSSHSVLVVSLLLVVELAGAAGEVSVVVQDQLKTSLVGGVAVGAVEGGHGDLDEGWVADLLTAVGRSAAGHARPTVGVSSATIFADVVRGAVLAVVVVFVADCVDVPAVGVVGARLLALAVLAEESFFAVVI